VVQPHRLTDGIVLRDARRRDDRRQEPARRRHELHANAVRIGEGVEVGRPRQPDALCGEFRPHLVQAIAFHRRAEVIDPRRGGGVRAEGDVPDAQPAVVPEWRTHFLEDLRIEDPAVEGRRLLWIGHGEADVLQT